MKKLTLLSLIVTLVFGLNSCKKDKNTDPANYFQYENTKYELNSGYLEYYGSNLNGSYDYDVFLVSSGIQYSQSEEDLMGTGNLVYLDLNTSSESGLINGTYTYSSGREAFTFVDGQAAIDVDLSTLLSGTFLEISGGTVEILVEAGIVTLDFDLTTSTNKSVTGHYKGTLQLL